MSNLNSIFDILKGWPQSSALTWDFAQYSQAGSDIPEGTVVHVIDDSGVASVDRHTSIYLTTTNLDCPWLVIRGKDETDAEFSGKLTCLRLRTGSIFRVPTTETPTVGDLVWAADGVLTKVDPGSLLDPVVPSPHLGKVIAFNADEDWMIVES